MTTDHAGGQDDDILAGVASLRTPDVSQRRARRLRRRCHTRLQAQSGPKEPAAAFQRVIGPALGGAWCLAYLVEIARRAAAVYLGAP
jgi:hypothetical protein